MITINFNSMLCVVFGAGIAMAAINVPSDGSDGALVITTNTVIDLGQAITGNWDANNAANGGKGIYDPSKWAVVFKYSSVTINSNITVTFANHPSRAPVVWLVRGDVTINGTLSLDGSKDVPPPWLAEPGPGGFRGGSGYYAAGAGRGAGFGPGGASVFGSEYAGVTGGGGSYGSSGRGAVPTYGNPSLIPLLGGSGGGGHQGGGAAPTSGGAGGGAVLVASGGTLHVSGIIKANGGANTTGSGGGSGGGIRLAAETLAGDGVVQALGGRGSTDNRAPGGLGRIRIERVTDSSSLQITPDPSLVTLSGGTTPQIWPPQSGPTVKIVSIGGQPAPQDPRASFGALGADVVLPQVPTTPVVVETTNVERAASVAIRVTPRSDGDYTETGATLSQVVTEDPLVIRWTANVPVKGGYAAIQVKVVRP